MAERIIFHGLMRLSLNKPSWNKFPMSVWKENVSPLICPATGKQSNFGRNKVANNLNENYCLYK